MSLTEVVAWRAQLVHAFEVLLEKPLSTYPADATYGTYFFCEFFGDDEHNPDPAWLDPAALRGDKTIALDDFKIYFEANGKDLGEPPIVFDASRSMFTLLSLDGFPDAFVTGFREVCDEEDRILGKDLGLLLAQHGIDLGQSAPGTWEVDAGRIASDGTLLDALCKAASIGSGPDSLLPCGVKVDRENEARLAAIPDPRLREHFRLACSTDGCNGLRLETTHRANLVATWNECQSQRTVSVFKLENDN